MKKLFLCLSLVVAMIVLVSCAPPASGESGAIAGQAVAGPVVRDIEYIRATQSSPGIGVGERTSISATCPPKTKFVTGECESFFSSIQALAQAGQNLQARPHEDLGFNTVGQYYTEFTNEIGFKLRIPLVY